MYEKKKCLQHSKILKCEQFYKHCFVIYYKIIKNTWLVNLVFIASIWTDIVGLTRIYRCTETLNVVTHFKLVINYDHFLDLWDFRTIEELSVLVNFWEYYLSWDIYWGNKDGRLSEIGNVYKRRMQI